MLFTALTSAEDDELHNDLRNIDEGQNDEDFFSKLPSKAADVPNLTKKLISLG